MDFSASTLWWVVAGALVALELATGTFYLLMLALGAGAGALAAHAGVGSTAQVAVAALVGLLTTASWHYKRSQRPSAAPPEANRDLQMDIGQLVNVTTWADDGSARVSYRGASWQVRYAGAAAAPSPGNFTIVAVDGNTLRVAEAKR